jgi:hypothetical protein
MCNAHNHWNSCGCGFGGDTGGGGGRRALIGTSRFVSVYEVLEHPISAGWAKDSQGTVKSYVNHNAHCPVCGELVFFYRSPYDGRVYFDELGWPWPKHPCTDNGREPRRTTRDSVGASRPRVVPQRRLDGWQPLLSARVHTSADSQRVTGDLGDSFQELLIPVGEKIDAGSPVLLRPLASKPYVFEMTFLHSTSLRVQERKSFAFDPKLTPVGVDIITAAASGDSAANYTIGAFILWRLDLPSNARPYLESAAAVGVADALIDLGVVELLAAPK